MNVYDFDGTIYDGDSTFDFWRHCMKKYPKVWRSLPATCLYGFLYAVRLYPRDQFKGKFYRFLKYIPDVRAEAKCFWDDAEKNIKKFYRNQKREDDIVISASPEFLIGEICDRLGIAWIASKVNLETGALEGPNCRDAEKVKRFREVYPDAHIDCFYSDSQADKYIAKLADKAFFVHKTEITAWHVR